MRRLFYILLLLAFLPAISRAQTLVTGHVKYPDTTAPTNVRGCFTLLNVSPNIPRVIGTGAIVAQKNYCITPAGDGSSSASLYGNNLISATATNWRVDFLYNSQQQSSATYLIDHSPFNVDNETPLSVSTPAGPDQLVTQAFPLTQLVAATTWTIPHNFNDPNVFIQVWDTNHKVIYPDTVNATDPNNTVLTFVVAQAGFAIAKHAAAINIATSQPNVVLQNPIGLQAIGGNYSTTGAGTHGGAETFAGTVAAQNVNKVIHAAGYGVVCDGVTVNSTTVTNAIAAGGQNAHVIFPPGTCLVSIEGGTFNVYDGSWYSGAGKFATIIKRANGGSANNHIFLIASGGGFDSTGNVLFTDMTIDGNQSNQTGWGDNIRGIAPTSKFTALRMRIINSGSWGINLALGAANQNNTDVLIADNDFEGNGIRAGCVAPLCSDIAVQAPLRVRVMRNRSDSSYLFFASGGHYGAGFLTISDNQVNNCTTFAVALGGGGTNPGPAAISNNTFICPGNTGNTVDMALWSGVRVQNNTINFGGTGIADGPPSNSVQITGNRLFGAPGNQGYCIGPGGNDILIADNFCTNAGGSGIGVNNGGGTLTARGISILNNTIKNSGQLVNATYSGIELFASAGGAFNGVLIKGNTAYDDQGIKTQNYGLAIPRVGQFTGFSNITVDGNNFQGNKLGGILNNTFGATGMVIANNPGGESSYLCQLTTCPTQTIGSGSITTLGTGIAAGTSQVQPTITVTGALATDRVFCSLPANPPATWQTGIQMLPPVPSANAVTIWLSNPTAGLITPAAATIQCTVTR